jgi:hypothetical protein
MTTPHEPGTPHYPEAPDWMETRCALDRHPARGTRAGREPIRPSGRRHPEARAAKPSVAPHPRAGDA